MRATLDKLISGAGLLVAIVLLIGGGLLTWASTFIGDQVNTQFSEQHITMPTNDATSTLPKADQSALAKYAGQPLTTGSQAQAYANHYIAVHMSEASGGKTYSEVSGQYIGQCSDPKAAATKACTDLGSLRQTMFMGSTLRGLLLYGYAFATIGTIAGIGAIVAYVGAAFLFLLPGLGFWHSRRKGHDVAAQSQPLGAHV